MSLLLPLLLGAALAAGPETWPLAREQAAEGAPLPPTGAERAAFVALLGGLARAAPAGVVPAGAEAAAASLGLSLRRDGDRLWVEEAGAGPRRGVGVYALRLGPLPREVVLQAPHPTTDLHTGAIVGALFDRGGVRAAAFATTRRDAGEGADAAHAPESWFQSATQALGEGLLQPLLVQVHGFGADTTDADAVLSLGPGRAAPPTLERLRAALAQALGGVVRTGDEVPALAARQNAQGRLLADRARFLHVELSLPQRERLRAGGPALTAFAAWLAAAADPRAAW